MSSSHSAFDPEVIKNAEEGEDPARNEDAAEEMLRLAIFKIDENLLIKKSASAAVKKFRAVVNESVWVRLLSERR